MMPMLARAFTSRTDGFISKLKTRDQGRSPNRFLVLNNLIRRQLQKIYHFSHKASRNFHRLYNSVWNLIASVLANLVYHA